MCVRVCVCVCEKGKGIEIRLFVGFATEVVVGVNGEGRYGF